MDFNYLEITFKNGNCNSPKKELLSQIIVSKLSAISYKLFVIIIFTYMQQLSTPCIKYEQTILAMHVVKMYKVKEVKNVNNFFVNV